MNQDAPPAGAPSALQQAIALHQQGRLAEAERGYLDCLAAAPEDAAALFYLGGLRNQQGRPGEAATLLRQALERDPDRPESWLQLGVAAKAQGDLATAAGCFEQAIARRPAWAVAHYNLGVVLQERKRSAEALRCFEQAIALRPDYAKAHCNLAAVLGALHRDAEALASSERALALQPDYAEAHSNRGSALASLGRHDEALLSLRRALSLDPAHANANHSHGLTGLKLGRMDAAAWNQHAYRWRLPSAGPYRHAALPPWDGRTDIRGRRILLWSEQGYGDTIQFCRYAPLVAARGAQVVLEVQAPLQGLLGSLEGVAQVFAVGDALPACDVQLPLLGLPQAFATTLATVPGRVPYLAADARKVDAWRAARAGPAGAPRIGIACSGNPGHQNDVRRSLALAALAPLFGLGHLILVQKDLRPQDEAMLRASPIEDPRGALGDFSDTAALVASLDLVISVDTSLVHVAGALGKPVWILLPADPDWRWMLHRTDSPWYPSARLFRQSTADDWMPVVRQVAEQLARLVRDGIAAPRAGEPLPD